MKREHRFTTALLVITAEGYRPRQNLEIADVIYNWIGKNVGLLKPAPTY